MAQHEATFDLAMWREREGVEPPEDIEGCPPSGLKSVEPTRAHTLPRQAEIVYAGRCFTAKSAIP